ncbi:hypothetical protein PVK06_017049 [Gossypium arboreum]|uniref:Uncharacterized protein n=1 Tax=Gossypium arboreum TaxID=29729 RepID=A0ABR0Q1W6_GOSAR|nr:hypothetical protein PVK06_017049 [Gossypium arboreum]
MSYNLEQDGDFEMATWCTYGGIVGCQGTLRLEHNGHYSVKSGYRCLYDGEASFRLHRFIWKHIEISSPHRSRSFRMEIMSWDPLYNIENWR